MTDVSGATQPGVEAEAAAAAPGPEAGQSGETEDTRSARQRVLDFLEDKGAQSVRQILQGTALERPLLETTLSRATKAGLIARVEQALYELVPPALPPPRPSEPPPCILDGKSTDAWLEAPHKAEEQKAAAERAPAVQALSEAKLLKTLISAANGNFVAGARIRDLTPIRVMLSDGVILEDIVSTLEARVDRRAAPNARPLASWSDHWLLCAIAGTCLQRTHVLRIVDSWLGKMESGTAADASRAWAAVEPGSAARAREVLRR